MADKGHVTTRYYGWYANRPRGMRRQAEGMKAHGIFNSARLEIGEIIVAEVNTGRVKELASADRTALDALIGKSAGSAATTARRG